MGLKPIECVLIAAVTGVPAAMVWIALRIVRRIREVNAEDAEQ